MAYGIKIARSKTWVTADSTDFDIGFSDDVSQAARFRDEARAVAAADRLSMNERKHLVAAKIPESKSAARDHAMMPRRNPAKKNPAKSYSLDVVRRDRRTGEELRREHADLKPMTLREAQTFQSKTSVYRAPKFTVSYEVVEIREPAKKNPPIPWREVEKKIGQTAEAVTTLIWTRAWREATSTYYIVYKPSTAQSWGKVAVISSQEDVPSGFDLARPAVVARERADVAKQVRSIMGKLPIVPTAEDYTG